MSQFRLPGRLASYSFLTLLIGLTCAATIISGLFELVSIRHFGVGPQGILTLHYPGFLRLWLWQFVTHMFVYGKPDEALTFGVLIDLAFQMLLLGVLGAQLIARMGTFKFARFYILAGVLSGAVGLMLMPLIGEYTAFSGSGAAILAVTVLWTMANPHAEMLLYFVLPVRARLLLVGVLAAILLVSLAQGLYSDAIHLLTAALFGYGYATIGWKLRSPFPVTHRFDDWLGSLFAPRKQVRHSSTSQASRGKIIDITSGNSRFEDEAFMDKMLDKVSKFGEKSLTREERQRMDSISQKKQ